MLVASNENCSDTVYKPIFVCIDDIISIQDNFVDSDLIMFINQSNQLEFNFSVLNNQHPFKYVVYDISGKLIVAEEKQYMQSGDYVEAIDLNGINPGVLIIQTQLNGKQRVQKLSYY
jgi:hypothetical protein